MRFQSPYVSLFCVLDVLRFPCNFNVTFINVIHIYIFSVQIYRERLETIYSSGEKNMEIREGLISSSS